MKKHVLLLTGIIGLCHLGMQAQHRTTQTPLKPHKTMGSAAEQVVLTQRFSAKTTAIWGAGASQGVADGEFANDFINASGFAVGANPDNWTALSGANAYWTRSTTGESQGAFWSTRTPLASPSQANGVALFDSDFLDNNGNPDALGTGTSPGPHRGELISPRIDLSGYSNKAIAIKVYFGYREYDISELSISLSNDDAASWTTFDVRNKIASNNEGFILLPFYDITNGLSDLTKFRIKLTFDGYYYYSMFDDISIVELTPLEFVVGQGDPSANMRSEVGDQIHLLNNRYIPISHISETHHVFAGVKIENIGFRDVKTSDNAKLTFNISKKVDNEWSTVHNQTIDIDTLLSQTNGLFNILVNSTSWISIGDFKVSYEVTSNISELFTDDNIAEHFVTITPNNYLSKVDKSEIGPQYNRSIFPGGNSFDAIEYGSSFYIGNANEDVTIDSLDFVYQVPWNFNGNANQTLLVKIYEYSPEDGFSSYDDAGLLKTIGITAIQLNDLGTAQAELSTYHTVTASGFVDASSGAPMPSIKGGKYYVFTIEINPGLFGAAPQFTASQVPWFGVSEHKNYNHNMISSIHNYPSPLFLREQNNSEWNEVGFGPDIVPSIGIHLTSTACTSLPLTAAFNNAVTGKTVTFTDNSVGDTTITTWSWDFGDGNTSTLQNPTHTYANDSTYQVCLTVSDGCATDNTCTTVTISTVSITENNLDDLTVFPVPAKETLHINGLNAQENYTISIVNQLGQTVKSITHSGNQVANIEVHQLKVGTYQLSIVSKHTATSRNILIVQ